MPRLRKEIRELSRDCDFFKVFEGTFTDELGDYPAGTYLRHPAGSAHAPASNEGSTIWVKSAHLAATIGPKGPEDRV